MSGRVIHAEKEAFALPRRGEALVAAGKDDCSVRIYRQHRLRRSKHVRDPDVPLRRHGHIAFVRKVHGEIDRQTPRHAGWPGERGDVAFFDYVAGDGHVYQDAGASDDSHLPAVHRRGAPPNHREVAAGRRIARRVEREWHSLIRVRTKLYRLWQVKPRRDARRVGCESLLAVRTLAELLNG